MLYNIIIKEVSSLLSISQKIAEFLFTHLNTPMLTMEYFLGNSIFNETFMAHANTVFELKDPCLKNVNIRLQKVSQ